MVTRSSLRRAFVQPLEAVAVMFGIIVTAIASYGRVGAALTDLRNSLAAQAGVEPGLYVEPMSFRCLRFLCGESPAGISWQTFTLGGNHRSHTWRYSVAHPDVWGVYFLLRRMFMLFEQPRNHEDGEPRVDLGRCLVGSIDLTFRQAQHVDPEGEDITVTLAAIVAVFPSISPEIYAILQGNAEDDDDEDEEADGENNNDDNEDDDEGDNKDDSPDDDGEDGSSGSGLSDIVRGSTVIIVR